LNPKENGAAMVAKKATVVGDVSYREGDGMPIVIPRGPCEISESFDSVTIGWADGDTAGSASMPKADFRGYVERGDIVIDQA
jgi:hypothetical protein